MTRATRTHRRHPLALHAVAARGVCRRAPGGGFVAVAAALCLVGARAGAQSPRAAALAANEAAARARFENAARHEQALSRAIDSLKEDRRRRSTRDTIRAGAIAIRVVGEEVSARGRKTIANATTDAWSAVDRLHDSTVTAAIAGEPLEVAAFRVPTAFVAHMFSIGIPRQFGRTNSLGPTFSSDEVRDAVLDLYGSTLGALLPKAAARWLGSAWLPLAPLGAGDWQAVATDLATSRSSVARDCGRGNVPSCLAALELTGAPVADPLRAWYTTGDITAIVVEWSPTDSAEKALRSRCVNDAVESDCVAAARRFNLAHPVLATVRRSVLQLALERGGPNGVSRFIAAGNDVPRALSAAAGMPLPTLVESWQSSAETAPLPRSLPGLGETITLLAWTAAFGVLATRRRP